MCEDYYRGLYDACQMMAYELDMPERFFAFDDHDSGQLYVVGLLYLEEVHKQLSEFVKTEFRGALREVNCGRSIVFEHDSQPDYHCGLCGDECGCRSPELPGDYLERLESECRRLIAIEFALAAEAV